MPDSTPKVVAASRAGHGAHQETDIRAGAVAWFGIVLFLVVAIVAVATHFGLSVADRRPAKGSGDVSPLAEERLPPEPRLQTAPPADMRTFRAHQDAVLNSAGWIDEGKGIAHIPIEDAKRLLLERGLPVREGSGGAKP